MTEQESFLKGVLIKRKEDLNGNNYARFPLHKHNNTP